MTGSLGGSGLIDALCVRASDDYVLLDLTGMRFCEPIGLVFIAALTEHVIREGERVIVRGPDDTNVANYLARMRLGSVLAGLGAEQDFPHVREKSVGDALFELSQFDGARGAGGLAALARIVHGSLPDTGLKCAKVPVA